MRVLLIDEHPAIAQGLRGMFADSKVDIELVVASLSDVPRLLAEQEFAFIITECSVDGKPVRSFFESRYSLGQLPPIVFLSEFDDTVEQALAFKSGFAGWVSKKESTKNIVVQFLNIAQGKQVWPSGFVKRANSVINATDSDATSVLTKREIDVLREVSLGKTNNEVARALDISYETVKEHVQHILNKLKVKDRTQAALWAVREKII